ncbi:MULTISPECIES: ATP-binding protein [Kitasatospora]|uniref:AAA family ATPase n=1 Tax=Kitasatospora cathayae TaxID=3004092 RepID=A0ABY7QDS8_9ACTN|nr:LuxR family transcriptional regulator [Kitasatospora sp. HUAS 3-15]WBP90384.1 AAA family ATPase [Kitasatospora sp. HUAS 3-15]
MLHDRDTELAAVRRALCDAAEGRSAHLLLTGPVGIGRSALLRALADPSGRPGPAGHPPVRVLRADAAPMEQDFAFGVVRQVFDSLLAVLPADDRERWLARAGAARPVLDDAVPDAAGPTGAVVEDLRRLLAELDPGTTRLLLVDDLQWVDGPSLRWLGHLTARLDDLRVVVVSTLRDGDQGSWDPLVREVADTARELRLAPLSPSATLALIRERFTAPRRPEVIGSETLGSVADQPHTDRSDIGGTGPDDIAPEFAEACHRAAAGNPLFLVALLDALAATARPTRDHAGTARTLRPGRLRDRIVTCLRAQGRPVRDLAAAIATLGEPGDTVLVGRLAGLDPVGCAAALRALHHLGLLPDPHRAAFVHPVVRDAVEASMSAGERQRRHEGAAAVLYDAGRPAEEVAHQLMAVAASRHPWSGAVLRSAADTALRRGEPALATRYLRRALLDVPDGDPERARLLVELAVAERPFNRSACERHIAQAIPLLATARERAAAALQLPPNFLRAASPTTTAVLRWVASELGDPDTLDGVAREAALRLEARLRHADCRDPARLADSMRRLGVMEPAVCSRGERELLAVLLHAATLGAGRPAAELAGLAERILEREPATLRSPHSVVPLLVTTLVGADAPGALESWLAAGERARHPRGSTEDSAPGHAEQALVHLARGRLALAREQAERARLRAEAGGPDGDGLATVALAAVALAARDLPLGSRVLADADRRWPTGAAPAAMLGLLRARQQAQHGDPIAALDTVLTCGRELESAGWRNPVLFPWRPWAVGLAHRIGDDFAARALINEELARAEAWGAPVALGRALRLQASLAGGGQAVDLLRESVDVLRRSADELERARALRDLGRRLSGGAEAAAVRREAARLAAACDAGWSEERSGADPGRAAGAPVDVVLTASERRVADLVGRGLTNQEIAAELRVSVRAVEKHLTNSYRKLGISGRRELVAVLCEAEPVVRV